MKGSESWRLFIPLGLFFLEILTGKPPSDKDFAAWGQNFIDDKHRLLRTIDPTL